MLMLLPLLMMLVSVSIVSAEDRNRNGGLTPGDPITVYKTPGLTTMHDQHGHSMNVRPTDLPGLSTYTTSDGQVGTIYEPFAPHKTPDLPSYDPPRLKRCPPDSNQVYC